MRRLTKITLILICCLQINVATFAAPKEQSTPQIINLPNSDGYGLIEKLAPVTPEEAKKLSKTGNNSCKMECETTFGEILGIADGAIARSNCQSRCIESAYSFLNLKTKEVTVHNKAPEDENLHYIGLIYQCVEYARKWWMINNGITFGDIDSAFEIIYLTEGKNIHSNEGFPLARSINGSAKRPPKRGDLVIYSADREDPLWRHGHVAVVVDVDLNNGSVSLAEENYDNIPWQEPKMYARKIQLFNVAGRYSLLDVELGNNKNAGGAEISGWIYPLED